MSGRANTGLSRRRFLGIAAAGLGLPLFVGEAGLSVLPLRHEWRGRVLGAQARLTLVHADSALAQATIGRCLDEVARLERVFSLYRDDSELVRLNAAARLKAPSHDLRRLLSEALHLAALTNGAFDPTVQPLWALYARHFRDYPDDENGPSAPTVARVRAAVGYQSVSLDETGVRLGRPGMALTLNGIAQGYITDRVAELLRAAGFDRVLAQLGEVSALAPLGEEPWRIGVPHPLEDERIVATLALANRSLATSSGLAGPFDRAGRFCHILDPVTGQSARQCLSVTVVAPNATVADGLSTALAVLPVEAGAGIVSRHADTGALYLLSDGALRRVGTLV